MNPTASAFFGACSDISERIQQSLFLKDRRIPRNSVSGSFNFRFLVFLLITICIAHAEEVNIRESRAEHLLDFDITYVLPVQLDIETLVDFPEG